MGLQDREYYRDDEAAPPSLQFNVNTLVVRLVFANIAIFLINLFSNAFVPEGAKPPALGWLFEYMAAAPQSLSNPKFIWQLLTYGFAHADPIHLGLNMFVLWMFGREVEERRGPTEFICVYLIAIVLGSAFWCGRLLYFHPGASGTLVGASGAVSCIVMLYVLANPFRKVLLMMVFPIPAWALGALVIALNIFGPQKNVATDVHLVGIAFAAVYFYSRIRFERMIPNWVFRATSSFKRQPTLKVHDPEAHYADLDAEADRILDKVHREGEGSLNRKERKILKDYSRRMRQKRQ